MNNEWPSLPELADMIAEVLLNDIQYHMPDGIRPAAKVAWLLDVNDKTIDFRITVAIPFSPDFNVEVPLSEFAKKHAGDKEGLLSVIRSVAENTAKRASWLAGEAYRKRAAIVELPDRRMPDYTKGPYMVQPSTFKTRERK